MVLQQTGLIILLCLICGANMSSDTCYEEGNFWCPQSEQCISYSQICDGVQNCNPYGDDEIGCVFTPDTVCGGVLTGEGNFSSLDYPQPYPNDANCIWTLTAVGGSTIQLQFIQFHTEDQFDYVTVYNGFTNSTGGTPLGARYTGRLEPFMLLLGSEATVEFTSDDVVQESGFLVHFTSVYGANDTCQNLGKFWCRQNQECIDHTLRCNGVQNCYPHGEDEIGCDVIIPYACGGTLSGEGNLTSPNYPQLYPNNANCTWTLIAYQGHTVQLQFDMFHTEAYYDYVTVQNGFSMSRGSTPYARYSGQLSSFALLLGSNTTVEFTSDDSGQYSGFFAKFTSVYFANDTCHNQGNFWCSDSKECVLSALRCNGVQNCHPLGEDEIGCSSTTTQSASPANVTCNAQGNIWCNQSQVCAYAVQRCDGVPNCYPYGEDEIGCTFTPITTIGSLPTASPAPRANDTCYNMGNFWCSQSQACVYAFLQCNGVQNCYPYGEDEIACASHTPPGSTSTTSPEPPANETCYNQGNFWCSLSLECVSSYQRCNGVQSCYYGEDEVGCAPTTPSPGCGGTLTRRGNFSSPNYPQSYPSNAHCTWRLIVDQGNSVQLRFDAYYMESGYDYVYVYYGSGAFVSASYSYRYTGLLAPFTLIIPSNATVIFTSDYIIEKTGFFVQFTSAPANETCYSQGNFWCNLSLQCVSSDQRCNGVQGCYYGEDEIGCAPTTSPALPANATCYNQGNFWCYLSHQCVSSYQRCNGVQGCYPFGEDEVGCAPSTPSPAPPANETCYNQGNFWCYLSQQCVSSYQRCNGVQNCYSGEDEIGCASTTPSPGCGGTLTWHGNFSSPNYPQSYPSNAYCTWRLIVDGGHSVKLQFDAYYTESGYDYVYVYYGSVTFVSASYAYRYTGLLAPFTLIIPSNATVIFTSDSVYEKTGFFVQFTSVPPGNATCYNQGSFWCNLSQQCVSSYQRCNGVQNCYYGEDEIGCASTTPFPSTTSAPASCNSAGYYWCSESLYCVYGGVPRCNGVQNCYPYGEDELGCVPSSTYSWQLPYRNISFPSSGRQVLTSWMLLTASVIQAAAFCIVLLTAES